MARSALPQKRLLRVAKAERQTLRDWKEGISLHRDSGLPLDTLVLQVASDRWALARTQRRDGNMLLRLRSPAYRCAISRYYYVMYHCIRAAVYIDHEGDDFEGHSELPKHVPEDFPDNNGWAHRLKTGRLSRNGADYDAYPKGDAAWRKKAVEIKSDADELLLVTRDYLRGKGCAL